jgi:hypothetical protein
MVARSNMGRRKTASGARVSAEVLPLHRGSCLWAPRCQPEKLFRVSGTRLRPMRWLVGVEPGDERLARAAVTICCGARSIAQRERPHGDCHPAKPVFAQPVAGPIDKALRRRHCSGRRPPRRLDPQVRRRPSASLSPDCLSSRSTAVSGTARASVLARIGLCPAIAVEHAPSARRGFCSR